MKISNKIKQIALASMVVLGMVASVVLPSSLAYADSKSQIQQGVVAAGGDEGDDGTVFTGTITNIINVILYIVGILAVVMIIFGGIQYTTSAGDTSKVTKAKNTILYGIVGLVISILAYAIVNFVISKV